MGNTSVNPPGPSTLGRIESAWQDQQLIYRRATVLTGAVAIFVAAAAIHCSFDGLTTQQSSAVRTNGVDLFTAISASSPLLIIELSIIASFAAVAVFTGAAALVDLHEHRLPNRLLGLSARTVAIGTVAMTVGHHLAETSRDLSNWSVVSADLFGPLMMVGIGTIGAGLPMLIVFLQRGIGMGDVKLAAVLGAAGGLVHPAIGVTTVVLMAIAASGYAAVRRRRALALGPWLWGAWIVAVIIACVTAAPGVSAATGQMPHQFRPAASPLAIQPVIDRVEMTR